MERERAKTKPQEPHASQAVNSNGHHTPLGHDAPAAGFAPRSRPNGSSLDLGHPPTDDNESLPGDTLNAGGSASSHASSASSVFSAPARPHGSSTVRSSNSQLTPLTTIDSPSSYLHAAGSTKAHSTTPRPADGAHGSVSIANGSVRDIPAALPSVAERVPARDPSRSIQCIKCTYDPLLDKSLSSSEKRKAKPIYKEFGLVCKFDTHTLRGERHLDIGLIG